MLVMVRPRVRQRAGNGYPALTQQRKEKILGQNAAQLQSYRKTASFWKRRDMIFNVPALRSRRELIARLAAFSGPRRT